MLYYELEQLVNEFFNEKGLNEYERIRAIDEIENLPRCGQSILCEQLQTYRCDNIQNFWEILHNIKTFFGVQ